MRRVVVVGVSGSGKSTVASAVAAAISAPHVELDALFHGPGWVPREDFEADVAHAVEASTWVVDGNYNQVRQLVWSRADTLIWLDLPRLTATRQVIWRSLRRWVDRSELWNGNREQARTWLRASHPIRWGWSKHPEYRATYAAVLAQPWTQHLTVHKLTSRSEVNAFLDDL